ncbi:MAG: CD225/dispanin family protein [Flavobacteriaceae bacterium]|nr:CD225/dispanin family protein [Flavobacteriaceae bacterium]
MEKSAAKKMIMCTYIFFIFKKFFNQNLKTLIMENQTQAQPPKNWLLQSILVTVLTFLCCSNILGLPFGIAGIVNATSVDSKFNRGDFEGAEKAAKNAKKWTIVAAVLALVSIIIYILLYVLGMMAFLGAAGSDFNF